jgi:hypothetical protein
MKNLVLSAFVAVLASQAAGCIIVDDNNTPTGNRIAATWNYKINGVAQPGCPAAANGVRLMVKSQTTAQEFTTNFTCAERILIDYFPDDTYQIWVELTSGGQPYARSLSVIENVTGVGKDITFDLHEDRGFFFLQWSLKGATSNTLLGCAQVPGLSYVGLLTTKVGTTTRVNSKFDCGPGVGVSQALEKGGHTVKIDAAAANDGTLGGLAALNNQQILDRNQVTDLGTVVIPIDGR